MINYTFDGTKSTFKNDMGEVTIKFKKASGTRVDIQVEMKHYATNTFATYKKYIALVDNGSLQHYPIKEFTVQGVSVGEYNTVKKYFTHILGEDGYKEFKEVFLNEYSLRLEIELNWFIKRT
ncbi:hypothetical protein HMPREF1210_02158 [Paenisporosarcina sp. HGH0030]|uniref:hypothetical protein n=1 Tax=Paenisporosarcina sp. HGH0030 TaxID=1078085 RepID=UPI00034EB4F4|nr:hypothetical protein [Paenisporosarcina sp. HGH0030]EPD50967.1 hypothetical protein HMPREF1210_02158 [Paenisporosarcina sp. HGH0030]